MLPKSPVGAFGRTILNGLLLALDAGVTFFWHSR
jgi:hypothetical protein